jgi:hypothetical protein
VLAGGVFLKNSAASILFLSGSRRGGAPDSGPDAIKMIHTALLDKVASVLDIL